MTTVAQARLEKALPAALERLKQIPNAYAALWCGSASRGEGTEGSDLDFHVLVTGNERWRSSFLADGVPVEVFHNPVSKVRAMFAAPDEASLAMFAQGKVVWAHPDLTALIEEARALWEAGPRAEAPTELDRFAVVEAVMDTRAQQGQPIHAALVHYALLRRVLPLLYRQRGWWAVQEKYLLTDLAQRDTTLAADLHEALTDAAAERQAAFERLALRLTGDFDYRPFEGKRQTVG